MAEYLKNVDKTAAFIIELVPGIFGFIGIGYIYSGKVIEGLVRMVAWIAILAFSWTIIAFLMIVLVGLCCIPFMIIAQFAVPIWSAVSLKRRLDEAYPD